MLNKYQSFIENYFLESIINESIIYYSPDLRKVITKLSKTNSIAQDLLSVETTDIKPDITFVDLDKEGYLSFSTMRNAKKNITDKFPHIDWIDTKVDIGIADELWSLDKRGSSRATGLYTKSRNQVGIGKFVNKIFPNKYNDKEREEFVNSFKSTIEKSGEQFQIVEGDDIAYWYNYQNYKEKSGTLGNSCMCEKPASFFDIYTKNPEICKMLILVEDDKLIGRALLWKVTKYRKIGGDFEGPEWFMDRQYTIKESDIQKFRTYADEQGWAYKTNNNHHSFASITWKGETFSVSMRIQLKNKTYGRYPYMDTFRRLDPDTGILYNDEEDDNEGHYLLHDTSGGYDETSSGVYSEWDGENIPEDRAVWSDYVDSYLWDSRAVEVTRGSRSHRGWYPEDHDDIVYDEWIDEHIHRDDAVYSGVYGHYLFAERAIEAIDSIFSDGDVKGYNWYHEDDDDIVYIHSSRTGIVNRRWYEVLSENHSDWRNQDYIHNKLLTKDFGDDWILKMMQLKTYKVTGASNDPNPVELKGVEFLTEVDAEILGWEVDIDESRTTDNFDYQVDIEDLIEIIEKRLNLKIQKLNNLLIGDRSDELPLEFDEKSVEEYKDKARTILNRLTTRLEEIENREWTI